MTAFHLLFPDPWPKRRHHRRRAFTAEFVLAIYRALVADGLIHIATDHADYFRQIKTVLGGSDIFVSLDQQNDFPLTTFERRFIARRVPIHRLVLRKVSPVK